jgi:hypothetical protein
MNENTKEFVRFGVFSASQIVISVITVVITQKASVWLTTKDIENSRPNQVRGFQSTPRL